MCCRKLSCLFDVVTMKSCAVVFLALGLDLAVVADDPVALLLAERRIGQNDVVALAARAEQRVGAATIGISRRRCRADRGSSPHSRTTSGTMSTPRKIVLAQLRMDAAGRAPSGCFFMCSQAASRNPPVPQAGRGPSVPARDRPPDHGVDQRARREVLAGAAFHLARRCAPAAPRRSRPWYRRGRPSQFSLSIRPTSRFSLAGSWISFCGLQEDRADQAASASTSLSSILP